MAYMERMVRLMNMARTEQETNAGLRMGVEEAMNTPEIQEFYQYLMNAKPSDIKGNEKQLDEQFAAALLKRNLKKQMDLAAVQESGYKEAYGFALKSDFFHNNPNHLKALKHMTFYMTKSYEFCMAAQEYNVDKATKLLETLQKIKEKRKEELSDEITLWMENPDKEFFIAGKYQKVNSETLRVACKTKMTFIKDLERDVHAHADCLNLLKIAKGLMTMSEAVSQAIPTVEEDDPHFANLMRGIIGLEETD